jgi:hypothetical protein
MLMSFGFRRAAPGPFVWGEEREMTPRDRLSVLAAVALMLGLAPFPAAVADRSQAHCLNVNGNWVGVLTPTGAAGVVTGDLVGTATSTVLEISPSGNGTLHYRLVHVFVTADGELSTQDEAVLTPIGPGLYRVNDRLEIVGGTGIYLNATGMLHTHGIANLNEGTLILSYNGRLCVQ